MLVVACQATNSDTHGDALQTVLPINSLTGHCQMRQQVFQNWQDLATGILGFIAACLFPAHTGVLSWPNAWQETDTEFLFEIQHSLLKPHASEVYYSLYGMYGGSASHASYVNLLTHSYAGPLIGSWNGNGNRWSLQSMCTAVHQDWSQCIGQSSALGMHTYRSWSLAVLNMYIVPSWQSTKQSQSNILCLYTFVLVSCNTSIG